METGNNLYNVPPLQVLYKTADGVTVRSPFCNFAENDVNYGNPRTPHSLPTGKKKPAFENKEPSAFTSHSGKPKKPINPSNQ